MRHGVKGRRFGRPTAQVRALLASVAVALIEQEQIKTTISKAKEIRPYVEKLITLGKRGDLHARRQALSQLMNNEAIVNKLFDVLAKRYASRSGGYTRIMHFGHRVGDATPMAIIEFVDRDVKALGARDREYAKKIEAEQAAAEAA